MIEAPVSTAPPPSTIREAFPVSWRLPERVPIVEFLEKNRHLSSKFSSNGGAYSLDRYPYLREVYETMTDPEAHWITLVASSQTGKTTLCENYLFYRVANDPTPAIWCFATEDLKNDFIDTKLKPAVLESPAWRTLLCDGARAISLQRADFLSMPVFYALADSEASMSMKSCGLVFADETGKFPANTTNEGSPIDQLRERQFTFPRWKFIDTSTPTSANDGIWPSYLASDMRIWSVPCPNCCKFHGWERHNIHHVERAAGESLLGLSARIDEDRAGALCWWQCPDCAHRVEGPEQQRIINEMNQAGKYIGRGYPKKHVGFQERVELESKAATAGEIWSAIAETIDRATWDAIRGKQTPTLSRLTQLLDREIARAEAAELEARKARESAEALQRAIDTLKGLV